MGIPFVSRFLANRRANKIEQEINVLPSDIRKIVRASLPRIQDFSRGLSLPSDYIALVREYAGWAYSCSNRNAASVASVPLRLYRGVPHSMLGKVRRKVPVKSVSKAEKDRLFGTASLQNVLHKSVDIEEVIDHPWYELIREVNPFLNGFSLMQLTVLYKQITGNAYWYVPKDVTGKPEMIWILPSQDVRVIPSPDKFIAGYRYGIEESTSEDLAAEDTTHFKCPNVKSQYYGLGPMEAAFTAVGLNGDFDEFERAILDNGAIIPFFLGTDQDLSGEALLRARKDINRLHQGYKKAGKFGILHSGLKPLPMAWAPKDINYKDGMRGTQEKIFGVFGVPMSKVTSESNRAHAEAGNYTYMKDTIYPECVSTADMINQDIMPSYDEKLFVAFDNPVPEDKEFLLKQQDQRMKSGSLLINETRAIDGLDPIEGGDEPLVSKNMATLDSIINPPKPPAPQIVTPEGQDNGGSDVAEETDDGQ